MSWDIDIIYTLPEPAIIDFFKRIPELESVFLVNDLQGISSEHSRSFMLSDNAHEHSHMRHGLPEGGLLAITPYIDRNIRKDPLIYSTERPGITNHKTIEGLPSKLKFKKDHLKLFSRLMLLNSKIDVPVMYYQCDMWGGLIDEEFSVVFNREVSVYWRDSNTYQALELKNNGDFEIKRTPLQKGLEYLGLTLPSEYFALHERNFDWGRYLIKRENANE